MTSRERRSRDPLGWVAPLMVTLGILGLASIVLWQA